MHPSLLTALLMRSGWALGGSNTNRSTFLVGAWSNLTTPGPRVGIRSQFDWLWLCMPFSWWGFMTKLGILTCDVFFGLPNCFGNWFSFAYCLWLKVPCLSVRGWNQRLAVESDGCWHHGSLWHPWFTNCWPHQQSMAIAVRHFVERS